MSRRPQDQKTRRFHGPFSCRAGRRTGRHTGFTARSHPAQAVKPVPVVPPQTAVSRILCPRLRALRRFGGGTTIPLVPALLTGSSDRPGGLERAALVTPPYLVLLRAGFGLPPALPRARCALTAPFHPYLRCARLADAKSPSAHQDAAAFPACRRLTGTLPRSRLAEGSPGRCRVPGLPKAHRDAAAFPAHLEGVGAPGIVARHSARVSRTQRRRYIFCATFLQVTLTGRYPAHCPAEFGLSSLPGDRPVRAWPGNSGRLADCGGSLTA